MEKILITGAAGQLGSELYTSLVKEYGEDNVIATDLIESDTSAHIFEKLDVTDATRLATLVKNYRITQIYNLAAILSAVGEKKPQLAWKVNMEGLLNVLEVASELKIKKIFWPSSIAVFGPGTPSELAPQETVMNPHSVYGISKLAGEKWCEYYFLKYGVDIRSLRYPGLIGYKSLPGGGTTDYAVDIYHKAVHGETFNCFLKKDTYLPLMYMPDAVKATLKLMQTPAAQIKVRTSYNVAAFSVSPEEISNSIKNKIHDFKINYQPDFRQEIADSWPKSIDDTAARNDWGWQPAFSLDAMTDDMLTNLLHTVKY